MTLGFTRLLLVLLLAGAPPLAADDEPVPLGSRSLIVENVRPSDVAMDDSGRFLVVWNETAPTGFPFAVGQRFKPDGSPLGDQLELTHPNDLQTVYRVAMSGAGDFAIDSDGPLIPPTPAFPWSVRRFSPEGTQLDTPYSGISHTPVRVLSMNTAGDFVAVWLEAPESGSITVHAQPFDSDGAPVGDPILVAESTVPDEFPFPATAIDDLGNFVVAWQAAALTYENDTSYVDRHIEARRFDSQGMSLGVAFPIDPSTTESQQAPSVAADASGNFVVVWSQLQGESDALVRARRFGSDGAALGESFPVSATPHVLSLVDLAMNTAGEFVVTWTGYSPEFPPGLGAEYGGILARAFHSDGMPAGSEFPVDAETSGLQNAAAVANGPDGAFVVTWTDLLTGRHAQRFVPAGFEFGSESFEELPLQNDAMGFATPNGLFFAVRDAQNEVVATLGGTLAESTGIAEEEGNPFWLLESRAGTITVTAEPIMTGLLPGEEATSGSFVDSFATQPDLRNAEIRVALRAAPVPSAALAASGTPSCDPKGRLLLGDVDGNVFATEPFELEPTFTEVSKHALEFDVPVGTAPSIDLSAINQLGFDLLVPCATPPAFLLGIDDVAVVAKNAVPAPAATAAAAAGLAALGALARWRRGKAALGEAC